MKKERDYQTELIHWIKEKFKQTGAFELKRAVHDVIPFSAVAEHQILALQNARHGCLAYKIPDGTGFQTPFDCFALAGVPAYVVVRFSRSFEFIDIDTWLLEKKRSPRKSLTYQRARELSTITVLRTV